MTQGCYQHPMLLLRYCVITINFPFTLLTKLIYLINYSEAVVCFCRYEQYVTVILSKQSCHYSSHRQGRGFKENIVVCPLHAASDHLASTELTN